MLYVFTGDCVVTRAFTERMASYQLINLLIGEGGQTVDEAHSRTHLLSPIECIIVRVIILRGGELNNDIEDRINLKNQLTFVLPAICAQRDTYSL